MLSNFLALVYWVSSGNKLNINPTTPTFSNHSHGLEIEGIKKGVERRRKNSLSDFEYEQAYILTLKLYTIHPRENHLCANIISLVINSKISIKS